MLHRIGENTAQFPLYFHSHEICCLQANSPFTHTYTGGLVVCLYEPFESYNTECTASASEWDITVETDGRNMQLYHTCCSHASEFKTQPCQIHHKDAVFSASLWQKVTAKWYNVILVIGQHLAGEAVYFLVVQQRMAKRMETVFHKYLQFSSRRS